MGACRPAAASALMISAAVLCQCVAVLLLCAGTAAAAGVEVQHTTAAEPAKGGGTHRKHHHSSKHKHHHHHQHHQAFKECLQGIYGAELVLPDDEDFHVSSQVFNPRIQERPAAVLFCSSTEQVAAGVGCAAQHGVRVSPSAGRQSFIGASVQPGALVVDVSRINTVTLSSDGRKLSVGAGTPVALLQSAIRAFAHERGLPGLAGPTLGSCSWVGTGGFMLGGGFGWLGKRLGLGCDSVVALEAVLADGSVVTADKDHHADLLWASCGGGGGTFAVVTRFDFQTTTLPNDGRVTYIELKSEVGVAATVQAALDFQAALPTIDTRLGLDGSSFGSGFGGPQFSIVGVFLGSKADASAVLAAAGLLQYAVVLEEKDSMYDAVLEKLGPLYTTLPPFKYAGPSPWQTQPWTGTPEQRAYLTGLFHGEPLQIVGGITPYPGLADMSWWYSTSRLVPALPRSALEAIAQYFADALAACQASRAAGGGEEGRWYCGMVSNGHSLGGQYAARASNATAFPWRRHAWLIATQFILPAGASAAAKAGAVAAADAFARLLDRVTPDGGAVAYVNYQLPETTPPTVWQPGYFGGNWGRLQRVKQHYDPDDLFGKPQTVTLPQGASSKGEL